MKPAKIAISIGAALIATWVLIVPGLVGMRAEADTNKDIADLSRSFSLPVTAKLESFDRGWFFSTAKTSYLIPVGPQFIRLTATHHINQLAIPFYHWAKISYDINLVDDKGLPAPSAIKANASSVKKFFGEKTLDFAIPEINFENGEGLHVAGKNITAKVNWITNGKQEYAFTVPSLTFTGPSPSSIDKAPFSVNLNSFSITGHSEGAQTAAGTWVLKSHVTLASIEATQGNTSIMKMDNLAMDADLKDHGQNIDMVYQTKIDKSLFGVANSVNINDIKFDFSYLNLNKEALLKWQAANHAFYAETTANPAGASSEIADQKAQIALFMKQIGDLARHSPGFKIDQFNFKTPNGEVATTFEVNFNGKDLAPDAFSSGNPITLIKERTSGQGALKLDRNVITKALDKQNLNSPDAQMLATQHQKLEAAIKTFIDQGFVKDDGKQLSLDYTFGPQGVVINGKPLEQLMQQARSLTQTIEPAPTAAPQIDNQPAAEVQPTPVARIEPALPVRNVVRINKPALARKRPKANVDLRSCLSLPSDKEVAACAERYN
jgi:uncharacterized protein YdgA (DUF945 family)